MSNKFLGLDMTQVNVLGLELLAASTAILPAVEKIIEVGAAKVKAEAKANIQAADLRGRLPAYPHSITYDMEVDPKGTVSGEVGPDKERPQGPLGNVLEYGTSKGRPVPHLQPALEGEVVIVQQQMAAVAGRLIWARKKP